MFVLAHVNLCACVKARAHAVRECGRGCVRACARERVLCVRVCFGWVVARARVCACVRACV